MSHTERTDVTYLNGHRVRIGGTVYARERTCRISVEKRKMSQTQTAVVKSCSECGFEYGVETENSFPFEVTIGAVEPPNFCPNCGAKVIGETE